MQKAGADERDLELSWDIPEEEVVVMDAEPIQPCSPAIDTEPPKVAENPQETHPKESFTESLPTDPVKQVGPEPEWPSEVHSAVNPSTSGLHRYHESSPRQFFARPTRMTTEDDNLGATRSSTRMVGDVRLEKAQAEGEPKQQSEALGYSQRSHQIEEPKSSQKIKVTTLPTAVQKVILVSGISGKLSLINDIAKQWSARAIIHTGNFGFFDCNSSPTGDGNGANEDESHSIESELDDFISGRKRFDVPLYVIWGFREDLRVIEKILKGLYHIPNLYILDHRNSYAISSESITLRLFGIGGSFSYPRLFDVGQGNDTVAGGEGKVWANLVQLGELLALAERYEDPDEVRLFICQPSPSKEPLAHYIASQIRADYVISASAGTQVCSIFNDGAIHTVPSMMGFLKPVREDIKSMWDQVYFACNEAFSDHQRKCCQRVITCLEQVSLIKNITEESLQRCTHIDLCPSHSGHVKMCLFSNGLFLESTHQHPSKPAINHKSTLEAPSESDTSKSQSYAVKETVSSPGSYYEDRRGSRGGGSSSAKRNLAASLVLKNLPRYITGLELDQACLSDYQIESIDFWSGCNEVALVSFKSVEEMEKARAGLTGMTIQGRPLYAETPRNEQ